MILPERNVMKNKLLLSLIATCIVTAPVFAKSSSNALSAFDPDTLQAIATQLKADALATATTPTAALTSVEDEIEQREENAERYAEAKAGFYRRLAGVLGVTLVHNLGFVQKPTFEAKHARELVAFNVIILGL